MPSSTGIGFPMFPEAIIQIVIETAAEKKLRFLKKCAEFRLRTEKLDSKYYFLRFSKILYLTPDYSSLLFLTSDFNKAFAKNY